ncbi:hypothetical protein E2562_008749 [Oryza meyeriana var. granulata]|uniref:YbaK/aminoacyl-tRNA synthetase-associated domain-containing protein n=1 Tax=Oryza meyeriana var. granulata TaxID=110450 RepID=A0A6G1F5Y4_9ORYZ|nr:hypothetical protein E2562_008749 [Oryza meyeriana var. granulata]
MDIAADLEARQLRILRRVADLELAAQQHRLRALSISAAPSAGDAKTSTTEARLSAILKARGVVDFTFRRVPADYYDRPLEERRDFLRADSVDQLCKSIVMVNTQAAADVVDCSNPKNSKYYVVVVQYMARLNADSIKNFIYALNEKQIPKKRFNMRLAPEEESQKLTGFVHNAVTCIGMETDIPFKCGGVLDDDYYILAFLISLGREGIFIFEVLKASDTKSFYTGYH